MENARKLLLAGDSAGANLACAAARWLRGRGGVDRLTLFYPVADIDMTRPADAIRWPSDR